MKKLLLTLVCFSFIFTISFGQKSLIGAGQIGGTLSLKKGDNVWIVMEAEVIDTKNKITSSVFSLEVKHPKKGWIEFSNLKQKDLEGLKQSSMIRLSGTAGFLKPNLNWKVEEGEGFLLEVLGLMGDTNRLFSYNFSGAKILSNKTRRGTQNVSINYEEIKWFCSRKNRNKYTTVECDYP